MKINRTIIWFSLAVLFQLIILLKIPSGQIDALQTGRTILLKAYAFDRDNIWSGAYLRLQFDISRPSSSKELQNLRTGDNVFVLLRQEENGTWTADRVVRNQPSGQKEDLVFLKGKIREDITPMHTVLRKQQDGSWRADSVVTGIRAAPFDLESEDQLVARTNLRQKSVAYGLENYFVPESKRKTIEQDLQQHMQEVMVEAKVDDEGNTALTHLRIQDKIYDF